jgi:LacI family transcriptional regulator
MSETPRVALLMVPFAGYDRGLLEGIARYAQLHGPWVFFLPGEYPEVPLPTCDSLSGEFIGQEYMSSVAAGVSLPDLRRWGVHGVIGRIQSLKMAEELLASGLPVIGIDLPEGQFARRDLLSRVSEIRADSQKAGQLAAEHFLERGFRNYAFCGYEGRVWSQRRLDGFAARLAEAGFSCQVYQPPRLKHGLSWKHELPAVTSWLKSLPQPVAIMACNDIRGRQVLEASLLSGLNVPEDVAVVGVDNDQFVCNLSYPPLSSVGVNLNQAGYQAAELLAGLMRGKVRRPRQVVAEALWVVPRRSSNVIATEDGHVAAALRFIRDHARESIDVDDMVRQTGISRRGLEIRFQQTLARSIRGEIERTRLVLTKQLLVETNLPAEQIARLAGFCGLSYLSTVFRRQAGMTLTQFRERMRVP